MINLKLLIAPFFIWPLILAAFFSAGHAVLARCESKTFPENGIVKIALAYGLFAHLFVLLGYMSALNPVFVWLSLTAAALPLFHLKGTAAAFKTWLKKAAGMLFPFGGGSFMTFMAVIFTATALLTLVLCLLPEISNDALAHHLNLPKRFMIQGRISPILYDIKSYQSLLMNALYTGALLIEGVATAKFFHWLSGILLILTAAEAFHSETLNRPLAYFLAVMLWLTPTLINQATTTYVDIAAVLFLFLSYILWNSAGRPAESTAAFLSGLFLGFSIITKLSAILAIPAFGILSLLDLKRSARRREVFSFLLLFAAGTLCATAFFLIRNIVLTGDPLFPMFSSLSQEDFRQTMYSLGPPKTTAGFFLIPFNITFQPWHYDYHHWLGPVYLIMLPFFAAAWRTDRQARNAIVFTCVFTAGWFFMGQNIRYLFPVFPVYLLAASKGLNVFMMREHRLPTRIAVPLAAAGLLISMTLLTVYHYRFQLQALLEGKGKGEYLSSLERTYPVAARMNQMPGSGKKVLVFGEVRLFYFDSDMVRANMLFQRRPELAALGGEEFMHAVARLGFDYILVAHPDSQEASGSSYDRYFPAGSKEMLTEESRNIRENRFRYKLFSLPAVEG